MPSNERELAKKARGAVLALFDKSLQKRLAAKKPKQEEAPKHEATESAPEEMSEDDKQALLAEYGKLGE